MSDTVIRVEGLGKKFKIGSQQPYHRFSEVVSGFGSQLAKAPARLFRKQRHTAEELAEKRSNEFWALKDINFEVKEGDVVGIIGRNGAGKSTLLKILSRITEPTEGRFGLKGRVASLLEVGTGFHPELTGRENIFLSGSVLGMSRAEIKRKFDEIVDFAGVEQFLDTPVKRYSSGMQVRLGFAVAAHLEPEILIVDEVLAVGDAEFQKKCLGKMNDVAESGRTILFVSHNLDVIRSLCKQGLLLSSGKVSAAGSIAIVSQQYDVQCRPVELTDIHNRSGTRLIQVTHWYILDSNGNQVECLQSGESYEFVFEVHNRMDKCVDVTFSMGVATSAGILLTRFHSDDYGARLRSCPGNQSIRVRIRSLPFSAGRYSFGYRLVAGLEEADYLPSSPLNFNVLGGDFFGTGRQSNHAPVLISGEMAVV
ncbi:MAG: ABC transporter ATP-binding protein [Rubinisphaera brasiliensis]|uniref:ABC transporter ATP-binding protein n=1 Tax=Rubinisphaera brasiliensis TaxID=119 RepID=UPI00391BA35F